MSWQPNFTNFAIYRLTSFTTSVNFLTGINSWSTQVTTYEINTL